MVTQGEVHMWNNVDRIARALERIADNLDKIVVIVEEDEASRKENT